MLPSNILLSCSCYFVAVIVFLRLLAVKRPTDFEAAHERVSRIGSILIWMFTLLAWLPHFVLSFPSTYDPDVVSITHSIAFVVCHTVPILSTVLMYIMLLCTLKRSWYTTYATTINQKSLAKMTQGVVVSLVVCNLPYGAWAKYAMAMYRKGKIDDVYNTIFGVTFLSVCKPITILITVDYTRS